MRLLFMFYILCLLLIVTSFLVNKDEYIEKDDECSKCFASI